VTTEDPLSELLRPGALAGGLPALLRVPDPTASTAAVGSIDEVTGPLFGLLGAIVRRDPQLVTAVDSSIAAVDSPEWSEGFRKVVVFVAWLLKDENIREEFLSGSIEKPSAISFSHFIGSPEEPDLPDIIRLERVLVYSFLLGLMMSRVMALTSGILNSILPSRPDITVLDLISSLTSAGSGQTDAHSRAAAAMADCLSFAAAHYARAGEKRERERLQATASSVLQVHELPLLASRVPHMLEKYGSKEVEVRFEQQLSLALQSYGFRTVPTPKGTRQGDIVCITDRTPPAALLVEAKTSAQPYKLPVKDERALLDYAQRLNGASWFQYPLRVICIVGQNPGSGIADRLSRLEANTQVPIRYCSTSVLVGLLTRPPVGVTTEDIVDALIAADRIVSKGQLISISSKAEEKLAAIRNSIRVFLA
jgi:hypothetical protein